MNYFYRDSVAEHGPVTFKELVVLVANAKIDPNDKVCIEDETAWQYASDIPGLFRMAGRAEIVAQWQSECVDVTYHDQMEEDVGFGLAELDGVLERFCEEADKEEPGWKKRIRVVEQQSTKDAIPEENAVSAVGALAEDALLDLDRKADKRKSLSALSDTMRNLVSSSNQRLAFKLVFSFLAANLMAHWILNWSESEAQANPQLVELVNGVRQFPLIGQCTSGEFLFLTADAMFLAGIAGYFSATVIEAAADD